MAKTRKDVGKKSISLKAVFEKFAGKPLPADKSNKTRSAPAKTSVPPSKILAQLANPLAPGQENLRLGKVVKSGKKRTVKPVPEHALGTRFSGSSCDISLFPHPYRIFPRKP